MKLFPWPPLSFDFYPGNYISYHPNSNLEETLVRRLPRRFHFVEKKVLEEKIRQAQLSNDVKALDENGEWKLISGNVAQIN